MANPSAAELDAALQTATREAEEIIPADRELQAILELIRTARDIMRSYSVTFESLEGKIPEPGDVPAAPGVPAHPATT